MPQIGDLFAKLGQGQTLSVGEIETLRLGMNRLESTASRMDGISTPAGGLDPNIFRNSGPFSTLPAECAVLQHGADLELADATWTTPTGWEALDGISIVSQGLTVDAENGRIYIHGVPGKTVVGFSAWALFESNATGVRSIRWNEAGTGNQVGSTVPGVAFVTGVLSTAIVTHVRALKTPDSYYYIDVFQNSGGPLDLQHLVFSAWRIR